MERLDRFLLGGAEAGGRSLQVNEVRPYRDPGNAVLEQVEAAADIHDVISLRAPTPAVTFKPVSAGKPTADKSTKVTDWLVYRVGGPRANLLGTVTAPGRKAALAKAYEEFHIEGEAARKRIIVLPSTMG
jgi:hypothetical protein